MSALADNWAMNRPELERVRIQHEDFDLTREIAQLRAGDQGGGAIATFIDTVRDRSGTVADTVRMELEHYPGMTERAIGKIVDEANARWQIIDCTVIHRYGALQPNDRIVLVAVASGHRGDAFAACEFIMDYLKTRAPFWKKEHTPEGARWVDAKGTDEQAAERWKEIAGPRR